MIELVWWNLKVETLDKRDRQKNIVNTLLVLPPVPFGRQVFGWWRGIFIVLMNIRWVGRKNSEVERATSMTEKWCFYFRRKHADNEGVFLPAARKKYSTIWKVQSLNVGIAYLTKCWLPIRKIRDERGWQIILAAIQKRMKFSMKYWFNAYEIFCKQ